MPRLESSYSRLVVDYHGVNSFEVRRWRWRIGLPSGSLGRRPSRCSYLLHAAHMRTCRHHFSHNQHHLGTVLLVSLGEAATYKIADDGEPECHGRWQSRPGCLPDLFVAFVRLLSIQSFDTSHQTLEMVLCTWKSQSVPLSYKLTHNLALNWIHTVGAKGTIWTCLPEISPLGAMYRNSHP